MSSAGFRDVQGTGNLDFFRAQHPGHYNLFGLCHVVGLDGVHKPATSNGALVVTKYVFMMPPLLD